MQFFSGPTSLKEQCTSVITSALLQHTLLEPDKLSAKLPDYVPTSVRCSITDIYKAQTYQLAKPFSAQEIASWLQDKQPNYEPLKLNKTE